VSLLDWIFIAVLVASVLLGAWRGLVFEVLSLLSWIVAFVLAQWFALDVGSRLPLGDASELLRYAAGFLIVFIVTMMLGGLMAALFKKVIGSVGLRPVDRILGAVFGVSRGVLLLLLATMLLAMTPMQASAMWQQSFCAQTAVMVLRSVKPALPRQFEPFLPA
jgi:membrane protein required for colicin V production